jgi:hypothetical protein
VVLSPAVRTIGFCLFSVQLFPSPFHCVDRTYRMNTRVGRELHDPLEPLPAVIWDIAWKA